MVNGQSWNQLYSVKDNRNKDCDLQLIINLGEEAKMIEYLNHLEVIEISCLKKQISTTTMQL